MPQDPYIGQLACYAFNFAPKDWVACAGQLLPINQYAALFSLLGTRFGGNGTTTFGLPNLQGRSVLGMAQNMPLGATGGEEGHTLTALEVPQHQHTLQCTTANASVATSANNMLAVTNPSAQVYGAGSLVQMNPGTVTNAGGSQPHENRTPYVVANWCIALIGIFPSRT